jgi:hypothetical protein
MSTYIGFGRVELDELPPGGEPGDSLVIGPGGQFEWDDIRAAARDENEEFLPPRMTKAKRNEIAFPADGLVIYQIDNTPGIRIRENGAWVRYAATTDD